jgi:WD40 repeat protein
MRTTRPFIRRFFLVLLTIMAIALVNAAPSAAADESKDTLFPGTKLVHKFPKEVYRGPVLVTTDKGPRLEIWFDEFDPEPPQQPGQIPGLTRLPDPRLELLIWDPIENKELHKLAYPKEPINFTHVSTLLDRDWAMTISPDGKRLASKTITYSPRPGSPFGDFTTQINAIDTESHKVQMVAEYKDEKSPAATPVRLLFAPDGTLVTIRGSTCTIRELDKDKPRMSFELKRAADYKTKEYWFKIQDVVISPDGSQLAVAADGTIIVYDLATGKKLFEASRASPEPKKTGDQTTADVSLTYAPSATELKLLAVESVIGKKDLILSRLFDLKEMKETRKWSVPERSWVVSAFFTGKGEPRILYQGKLIDFASGKELHKFDPGVCTFVSRDGKALVRTTKKKKEEKTMTVELWSLDSDK